jgi:hypothetical protein
VNGTLNTESSVLVRYRYIFARVLKFYEVDIGILSSEAIIHHITIKKIKKGGLIISHVFLGSRWSFQARE